MSKYTDFLLVLLTLVSWVVAIVALVQSDGVCRGECKGCVFGGWCPQERK